MRGGAVTASASQMVGLSAKNPKLALQQGEGIERFIDRIERFIDIWIDRFVEMDEDELESLTWEE